MTPVETLAELAKKYDLEDSAKLVLEDKRFPLWSASCSPNKHHYGTGKLAEHTLDVVQLCLQNNDYFSKIGKNKGVDEAELFAAALFHDAGKMWDYEPINDYKDWKPTSHKFLIHHISRSAWLWQEAGKLSPFNMATRDYISHAILSHHGRKEWGSPVEPGTPVAWLLHFCDGLSARMDDWFTMRMTR